MPVLSLSKRPDHFDTLRTGMVGIAHPYSISNLKQHEFLLWERPPGRDKLDRGQEAAPTKAPLLN